MSAIWTPKPIGRRLPGWERRATEVLQRHLGQPLTYGPSDCLTVPADLCKAMTGVTILPAHLRRYTTEAGAYRLLAKMGFKDVEEALSAAFPSVAPAMARRFDAGIVERFIDGKSVLSTVIVSDRGHAVGRDALGPILVDVLDLRATFAIGAR